MSGWQTFTVDAVDEESAEELASTFNVEYEGSMDGDARVSDEQVRGIEWGYHGGAMVMHDLLKRRTDLWQNAVLMDCNDTSDSGSGKAYSAEGGSMEQVDSAHGVEGARGRDASHELKRYVDGHVEMR